MKSLLLLALSALGLALPAAAQPCGPGTCPMLTLLECSVSTNIVRVGEPVTLTVRWLDTNAPRWCHDWLTRVHWGDGPMVIYYARDLRVSHTYTAPIHTGIHIYTADFCRSTGDMGFANVTVAVIGTNEVVTPPAFTAQSVETNGVQLALSGDPGRLYRIQASTNYVDWFTVNSAAADAAGQILANDPAPAAEGARLYRAVFP